MLSRRGAAPCALPAAGRDTSPPYTITRETSTPDVDVLGTSSILGSVGKQRVRYTDMHKQSDEVSTSSLRVGGEGRIAPS